MFLRQDLVAILRLLSGGIVSYGTLGNLPPSTFRTEFSAHAIGEARYILRELRYIGLGLGRWGFAQPGDRKGRVWVYHY
jgi:hypothetical protein